MISNPEKPESVDSAQLQHFFTYFRNLGGVQSILGYHLTMDPKAGFRTGITAFFDPETRGRDSVMGLGFSWRTNIYQARKTFRKKVSTSNQGIAIYHNLWGIHFLSDLEQTRRRIGILHSYWPNLENQLPRMSGYLDGILCVSRPLAELVSDSIPSLNPDRIREIPYPVEKPNHVSASNSPFPLKGRSIRIGIVGRVSREQKRIDRIPALCDVLTRNNLPYKLEILGDGPELKWLKNQQACAPVIHCHGRLDGDNYWNVLKEWDFILFVSDYEGTPISLLEAMSLGVIPIFPKIGSGGDDITRKVSDEFLYPPADFDAVFKILERSCQWSQEIQKHWRKQCMTAADNHDPDSYHRVFTGFVEKISNMPRISTRNPSSQRPFFLSDWIPFGLMRRVYPKGFFKPVIDVNEKSSLMD